MRWLFPRRTQISAVDFTAPADLIRHQARPLGMHVSVSKQERRR
jgi:hypothetical protein